MGISLEAIAIAIAIAKITMEKERWLALCSARYSEEAEYGRFGRNAKRGLLFVNAVTAFNSLSVTSRIDRMLLCAYVRLDIVSLFSLFSKLHYRVVYHA